MKRKLQLDKSPTGRKKGKYNSETDADTEPFLTGLKCHIHPANFGAHRLKILQNLVSRYGGTVVDTLSSTSNDLYYIIFEESVSSNQLNSLIDQSNLTEVLCLSCTWLVECIKAKQKVETKPYEIVSEEKSKLAINVEREACQQHVLARHDTTTQVSTTNCDEENGKAEQDIPYEVIANTTNKGGPGVIDDKSHLLPSCSTDDSKNAEGEGYELETATEEDKCRKTEIVVKSEALETEDHNTLQALVKPLPKFIQDKFACARPSSSKVKDLNAHITLELEKLASSYKSKNDTWRALGYQKAISAIRNYPKEITSREEALKIPGVGERLADKVAEILSSGQLQKVAEVCEGEEAETLKLFMGVWGAGPSTAQAWYTQGMRTLEDVSTKATLTRHQQIGIRLYEDLNTRIPREEVAEIESYVRKAAGELIHGLVLEVCGSYRRGKSTCGDVDVLITHPDGCSHENLFRPLLAHLKESGFLTDDLVCQEENGNQQKYLGVCRLPGKGRRHRRLDVIVVPYSEFAPAIMYFTGSAHFNRSMRLLATKKGMSLSEHGLRVGIVRQGREKLNEGKLLDTPSEESIFTHLGLQYRPPHERDH